MKRLLHPYAVLGALTASLTLVVCTGCGGDDGHDKPTGGGGVGALGGSGGTAAFGGTGGTGAGGANCGGGEPVDTTRMTISGDATWTVTFDADAQAAGATDCTYTRHYEGVENMSAPWLCPQCEVIFQATIQMTDGEATCFSQVSENPPFEDEWVGYGGGVWWRGYGGPTTDQGTATVTADSVTTANLVEDLEADVIGAGTMAFNVAGQFTLGTEDGDPMHGWHPTPCSTCGWPETSAGPYSGDYAIPDGATLPDGVFMDRCGENRRLYDFRGTYLVVDMSAVNCPACQSMSSAKPGFKSTMAANGIEVEFISLLAPSLDDPLGETSLAQLEGWTNNHGLSSPVLADRAWGICMFLPFTVDVLSFPGWVVVDPDLKVLMHGDGFTSFDPIEAAIIADAG